LHPPPLSCKNHFALGQPCFYFNHFAATNVTGFSETLSLARKSLSLEKNSLSLAEKFLSLAEKFLSLAEKFLS